MIGNILHFIIFKRTVIINLLLKPSPLFYLKNNHQRTVTSFFIEKRQMYLASFSVSTLWRKVQTSIYGKYRHKMDTIKSLCQFQFILWTWRNEGLKYEYYVNSNAIICCNVSQDLQWSRKSFCLQNNICFQDVSKRRKTLTLLLEI